MTHVNETETANNPLFLLLKAENVKEYNETKAKSQDLDLSNCLFRGLDLRGMNTDGVNFTNAYFRGADLRGVDFRKARLEGASFADAKISGCYFPENLCAAEIRLSQEKGIRVRTSG